MRPQANFNIVSFTEDYVAIVDQSEIGPTTSVTNDAEAVVKYINDNYPKRRIVYKDSMGRWDELQHIDGEFVGFAPIGAKSLVEALERLND